MVLSATSIVGTALVLSCIRFSKRLLRTDPFWGLAALRVLQKCLRDDGYAVLWRETASLAISHDLPPSASQKILHVLNYRKIQPSKIDGNKVHQWCEPFCRFLARHANYDQLTWAFHQSVCFGVRTTSGGGFLSDAVVYNNLYALQWARDQRFNFNILAHNQMPLLAFLIMNKSPFHPFVALFLQAGASMDFKGSFGCSAQSVIEQNKVWKSQWEKKMLLDEIPQQSFLTPSQPRRM